MNYYEESGLQPTAVEDDIRRAHWALAKLLHPDHQTDPSIRDAAESQMRRINGIIDILLDSHRREQYDQHLRMSQPHTVGDAHAVIGRFPAVRILGSVLGNGKVKEYVLSFGATVFFAVALP